jgi:hypothetical protein
VTDPKLIAAVERALTAAIDQKCLNPIRTLRGWLKPEDRARVKEALAEVEAAKARLTRVLYQLLPAEERVRLAARMIARDCGGRPEEVEQFLREQEGSPPAPLTPTPPAWKRAEGEAP